MCFVFKQKTAYEMRISDWSSDVCSSDLTACLHVAPLLTRVADNLAQIGFRLGGQHIAGAQAGPSLFSSSSRMVSIPLAELSADKPASIRWPSKIGRASCRERVCQYV